MQKLPITLYNSSQIKELERIAIQQYDISGFELMSRAGYQIFECLQQRYPAARTVAVFCGCGNNAGDGYVLAGLALAVGWSVCVYSLCDPEQLKGDALTAYRNYQQNNGEVLLYQADLPINADVLVDALFGTGLARAITGIYADAVEVINKSRLPVIAVDIPSGLNADTGNVMGCAVKADCTVTFIALKQGLFTGQAGEYCGEIFYASLAVPEQVLQQVPSNVRRVIRQPLSPRKQYSHKGNFGHVLVIGGEQGYSGAARLAGEAALRVGAGLVSIATRAVHAGLMNLTRPELMCHGVETITQLDRLLKKADVIIIGPGLGQSTWAEELFFAAVNAGIDKHLVIDADALTILAKFSTTNLNLADGLNRWVLTPHVGEAGRLLSCPNDEITQDRFAAVSAMQHRYGGVVLLKGAGTLIADGQEVAVSTTGNPGMASGGMGDVLSGVIGALLAQGLSLKNAAQQGAYLHGLAADLSVQQHGERGLLAADLMPHLRRLVNS